MIRTTQEQQKFNKNIVIRIQELEDKRPSKLDDQVDIKLMKQNEVNELQVTINRNIVERIEELEDKRPNKLDDQVDIKLMKQDEWSEHINQLLEGIDKILEENEEKTTGLDIATRLLRNDSQILRKEFEEFKESTVTRLDQEIENRTKAFERIQELETGAEALHAFSKDADIKLERNDEIRAVHRNEIDNLKKNFHELKKVWDNKVMDLLEKDVPRVTDKEQAIIDLNKKLFGNKKGEHEKG